MNEDFWEINIVWVLPHINYIIISEIFQLSEAFEQGNSLPLPCKNSISIGTLSLSIPHFFYFYAKLLNLSSTEKATFTHFPLTIRILEVL